MSRTTVGQLLCLGLGVALVLYIMFAAPLPVAPPAPGHSTPPPTYPYRFGGRP